MTQPGSFEESSDRAAEIPSPARRRDRTSAIPSPGRLRRRQITVDGDVSIPLEPRRQGQTSSGPVADIASTKANAVWSSAVGHEAAFPSERRITAVCAIRPVLAFCLFVDESDVERIQIGAVAVTTEIDCFPEIVVGSSADAEHGRARRHLQEPFLVRLGHSGTDVLLGHT
jgi:hypothetical protein